MSDKNNATVSTDKPKGEPFFNLSPWGNFRVGSFLFIVILFLAMCLCFGITASLGKINDNIFWNFISNASAKKIKRIEVQEASDFNTDTKHTIVIEDEEAISNFVTALSTIQEYDPDQISGEDNLRILVKLNAIETIEINCYTIQGSDSIIVSSVFISPNFLASSVTTAIFPESSLHDWLISVGVNLQ